MTRVHCRYTGDLRCEAEHGPSGAVIRTDNPLEGERNPEAFGPTDLVAASVGTCILTVMGIVARRRGWDLTGSSVDVDKTMASEGPRRIGHLRVAISLPAALDAQQRSLLQRAAETCPVKHNLEQTAEIDLVWL